MVGTTECGIGYAHCAECGAFETRKTEDGARRWLELHIAFDHTAGGCHVCQRPAPSGGG